MSDVDTDGPRRDLRVLFLAANPAVQVNPPRRHYDNRFLADVAERRDLRADHP